MGMVKTLCVLSIVLGVVTPCFAEVPQLDKVIPRFHVNCMEPTYISYELMRRTGIRSGVEITWKGEFHSSPRVIFFKNASLREVLDNIVDIGDRRIYWKVSGDFIHFMPFVGAWKPEYVMNKRIGPIDLDEKATDAFLEKLNKLLPEEFHVKFIDRNRERFDFPFGWSGPDLKEFSHFVFLGGTLRELADTVARTQPNGHWAYIPRDVLTFATDEFCRQAGTKNERVFDTDMIVLMSERVFLGVPTTQLLEELKSLDLRKPVPSELAWVIYELCDRAPDDVNLLIEAYWNPANEPYKGLKCEIVYALARVGSERARSFLLQALSKVSPKDRDLFGSIGFAVADQYIAEGLPLLRTFASSEAADKDVRDAAGFYIRMVEGRYGEGFGTEKVVPEAVKGQSDVK